MLEEEEQFDPDSIPLMTWAQYEANNPESLYSRSESKGNTLGYSDGKYGESYGYSSLTRSTLTTGYTYSEYGSTSEHSVGLHHRHANSRMPSDEEILEEIRHILSTTDLMKVTKKSVRDRLSALYGVDMIIKKEYIHTCIDMILKGNL